VVLQRLTPKLVRTVGEMKCGVVGKYSHVHNAQRCAAEHPVLYGLASTLARTDAVLNSSTSADLSSFILTRR